MQHVKNIQYVYLLNKYLKCSVWRLALRYDIYMSLGFKRLISFHAYIVRHIAVNKSSHLICTHLPPVTEQKPLRQSVSLQMRFRVWFLIYATGSRILFFTTPSLIIKGRKGGLFIATRILVGLGLESEVDLQLHRLNQPADLDIDHWPSLLSRYENKDWSHVTKKNSSQEQSYGCMESVIFSSQRQDSQWSSKNS